MPPEHFLTRSRHRYFAFDFADTLEAIRSTAGLIASVQNGQLPAMGDADRSAMVIREPYGVVVAIAPWNCPCILLTRSFLGPLASEWSATHYHF
jgi:acyl-CoA reductase-like NAD-dependent aldehyde dehydrogenase